MVTGTHPHTSTFALPTALGRIHTVRQPGTNKPHPDTAKRIPSSPPPLLTLLAHVDATPSDLEVFETAEIESMESVVRPDTQLIVQLRRTPSRPWIKVAQGAALTAIGASLVYIASSLPIATFPIIAPVLSLAGFVASGGGAQRFIEGAMEIGVSREPEWQSTRTYLIGPDKTRKIIDSPVLHEVPDIEDEHTASHLRDFLVTHLRRPPAQVTALMLGGHGLAYELCAGLTTADLRNTLVKAIHKAKRKPDVLILEACLMGNLESLNMLRSCANYAIVSEQTMGAQGLPWTKILPNLPPAKLTAKEFCNIVTRESWDAEEIDTLATIDLAAVPPLTQAVEGLAAELLRLCHSKQRRRVRHILRSGRRFGESLRDLGDIARSVRESTSDARANQAAVQVLQALQAAVVSRAYSFKYGGASHISIETKTPQDKDAYVTQTGMRTWAALLEETQGWSWFF